MAEDVEEPPLGKRRQGSAVEGAEPVGAPTRPPSPFPLPDGRVFVGRKKELADLASSLLSPKGPKLGRHPVPSGHDGTDRRHPPIPGQLDEALRIRQEEQLPVYEKLDDRRGLLVGRANLALTFLARNQNGDREAAHSLLLQALPSAREMRLPEAAQIEAILQKNGLAAE